MRISEEELTRLSPKEFPTQSKSGKPTSTESKKRQKRPERGEEKPVESFKGEVFLDANVSVGAKATYGVLFYYSMQKGRPQPCWPQQSTIARHLSKGKDKVKASVRSVKRFLAELVMENYLVIKNRGAGKGNIYILNICGEVGDLSTKYFEGTGVSPQNRGSKFEGTGVSPEKPGEGTGVSPQNKDIHSEDTQQDWTEGEEEPGPTIVLNHWEPKQRKKALLYRGSLEEDKDVMCELLVKDILAAIGGKDSRQYYQLVAREIDHELVRNALSETKDAMRHGTGVKSPGRFFTASLKGMIKQRGGTWPFATKGTGFVREVIRRAEK